ncbi:SRPBCC family protein [Intrasporangium flavum]|uniref:SRPBCC family protein n=1 Tax=Intrasporangium flavum TaxID=1428657 RepID=UPI00096EE40C|nr:SRPBCC family protein [Intrasporangium flavum]
MGFLRGLLGDGGAQEPVTVVPRNVSHRVFVESTPDAVWRALVAPAPDAEHGVDCVGVLALPRAEPTGLPEFAGVWRRSDGRLWAGLSTVVDLDPGRRVVARSADGAAPFQLTTTVEPLNHGTVVAQVLDGLAPGDPLAGFARTWIARGLLGLKADVEGRPRDVPEAATVPDRRDASTPSSVAAGVVPVTVSASVDLTLTPDRLWAFLADPASAPLLHADVERVVRLELADAPGTEHVLAVHRGADGRRAASVSVLVESAAPTRIVERDLSAPRESDVETVVEPTPDGCRLRETVTAWLPTTPGTTPDTSALTAFLRARLETVRTLAEGGTAAPRDPRTGFLPPGSPGSRGSLGPGGSPSAPPGEPDAPAAPEVVTDAVAGPVPGGRPSVPSSVLLPPPHVVAPARPYLTRSAWWTWADYDVDSLGDLGWW